LDVRLKEFSMSNVSTINNLVIVVSSHFESWNLIKVFPHVAIQEVIHMNHFMTQSANNFLKVVAVWILYNTDLKLM